MRVGLYIPVLLILSLAVIGGALIFQYAVGLVPCELCLYERWPWYAAIVVLVALLVARPSALVPWAPLLLALLFVASSALGIYHVGVEQHIFPGPDACTGPALHGQTIEELTRQLLSTPAVRCDEPQWSLFGVSLAGWNVVASLMAVLLCFRAWQRTWR
jgi:disulfide bond formation protein DsbB